MSRKNFAGTVERSYKNAMDILNRRRRPARPTSKPTVSYAGIDRMPDLKGTSDLHGTPSIIGMEQWLQHLGHSATDIDRLNIIHVAGTKGKGSTCAFIDSFLQCHSERSGYPCKTGLYTSPHLIVPEERIRINMKPLERSLFAKYFFEVVELLSKKDPEDFEVRPRFLQLFLLVAFHTFIQEGVDAAIIETHHGGEYDATNVVDHPVVAAITSLGMDHVNQLGPSIENIAWHKAGIFKHGAAAFSVVEDGPVAKVLQDRAAAKGVDLKFVNVDPSLPQDEINLKPSVQRLNCSLALAVVRAFIRRKASTVMDSYLHPDDVINGIRRFSWPGRFQIIAKQNNRWFLDGAHNEMSVDVAGKWFMEASAAIQGPYPYPRILIFGHVTEQRDATAVIRSLASSFQPGDIQIAIFTMYDPVQDFEATTENLVKHADLSILQDFSYVWTARHAKSEVIFTADVPHALARAREFGDVNGGMQTLVTGSQHLVGAALFYLNQPSRL
ncbi:putative tetrahydrofolylpolyglutamate synthase [Lojkania enalia]|uniref:tetrahydrofolate synthase n=1 Tax=Lojkania enalia TaxID=147567 RepID=A0A9P4JXQ2_9PLEO|nr:putative tetrahydrofolylpolyglutamate synthase [Didymosphaeria enalia]